jgi:ribonuclease P protein component
MRRSADFTATVRRGRRGSSGTVSVHIADAATDAMSAGTPSVGFVVSTAVGPAVTRNRVRRRLRHLVRARLDGLPAGASVVVRAHPAAAAASSVQLGRDLDDALRRAYRTPARSVP